MLCLYLIKWIFKECDNTQEQFPHKQMRFWFKENQKYYTTIELYQLFLESKQLKNK